MRHLAVLFGGLLLSACTVDATSSSSDLTVNEVTFAPGCGIAPSPQGDCSYGFVMSYVHRGTTVFTHATDNGAKTVDITASGLPDGTTQMVPEDNKALGLLDAKPGQTYTVTVYDANHAVLWSGKVDTLYHL